MGHVKPDSAATAAMADDLTPEELVSVYLEPVYRFAAMLCPSATDRDDLAQDALIRVICHRQQYNPERGDLQAWLWRIVVNVAKDHKRAARRASTLWERLLPLGDGAAEADSAESQALRLIESETLLAAIHRLPRRQRTLIALRFGAGLRYCELAGSLGISEGAATQALRRALAALRRLLEEWQREATGPSAAEKLTEPERSTLEVHTRDKRRTLKEVH